MLNGIEKDITNLRSKSSPDTDKFIWKTSEQTYSNKFRTKETWRLLRPNQHKKERYRGVWFNYATPRYAFIAWLANHNRLSTGDRISNWNAGLSTYCVFCGFHVETRNHLFFFCPFSTKLWRPLMLKLLAENYSVEWDQLMLLLSNSSLDKITPSIRHCITFGEKGIGVPWRDIIHVFSAC